MGRYQIIGVPRVAAFIAQIGHESGQLRYVRETWGPTPIQARYEAGQTSAIPRKATASNSVGGDRSKSRAGRTTQRAAKPWVLT
jgi:putative chitinase